MKHFRKVWTAELREWLRAHKGMPRKEAYGLFLAEFPGLSDVTECAFYNERSRVGAVAYHATHGPTLARPLYAEQVKKGYVRIKVAQPNVWMMKSKWVYMETHPWEDFTERSNYVFLDGDARNFDPANIERVPLRIMGMFNLMGGTARGDPGTTRLRILLAKMKMAEFDAGERAGLVVPVSPTGRSRGRVFREERNRRAREYNSTPERKRIVSERARAYRERLRGGKPRQAGCDERAAQGVHEGVKEEEGGLERVDFPAEGFEGGEDAGLVRAGVGFAARDKELHGHAEGLGDSAGFGSVGQPISGGKILDSASVEPTLR